MEPRPFTTLESPRNVGRPDLPADLADFYTGKEGIGSDGDPDLVVRLYRLDELARIDWSDIGDEDDCPGWDDFSGLLIGASAWGDEFVYVLNAPCCEPGAILALGADIGGPGGIGPNTMEGSLVLAPSFSAWLTRLEQDSWEEYGLRPGAIAELPLARQRQLRQDFQALNLEITWGDT